MKRKFIITAPVILLLSWGLFQANLFSSGQSNLISAITSGGSDYNKGIAYLLVNDMESAKRFFKLYFSMNLQPNIENGYRLLTNGEYSDAARQFSDFLEISPRSTLSLVGIALATSTMEVSNAKELLKRAIWLNEEFSAAYLCLGREYQKEKNYPLAEQNFKRALTIANIPEYKIPLAHLYFDMKKTGAVLDLLKEEADRVPVNFHFNFLVAQAYFQLNRLGELWRYAQAALDAQPNSNEVRLLMANYYLNINDAQKANLILKGLKFEEYNEDYLKAYGHALVLLKDKKAREYLYEVFARKKWDKDINRLLGLYHLWMGDKGLVQNWLYRAILSGDEINRLKELFSDQYKYYEYKYMPFFDVKQVAWINENTLLAAAARESGEPEQIFLINWPKMQVIQSLSFNGKFQGLFIPGNRERFILAAVAPENGGVYLYAANLTDREIRLQPVWEQPLAISTALVGFDRTGNMAYITDRKIEEVAFKSPFSQVDPYGKKKPVYPVYPFPIYKYNFDTQNLTRVKEVTSIETAPPIEAVKRYALVANAIDANKEVQALVEKGQKMDLASPELVKIFFPGTLTAFIIYISDLKNAFHGVVWDQLVSQVTPVDETIFLGKGKYAELTIVDFDPVRKEILVLAKNDKDLILYNYGTQSSMRLAREAFNVHLNPADRILYVLNERSDKVFFTGSGLQVVSLSPYVNKSVSTSKNLLDIISHSKEGDVYFSTMDGEIVKMDDQYNFSYMGPDMNGSISAVSPSAKRTAAFINGKLWLIE